MLSKAVCYECFTSTHRQADVQAGIDNSPVVKECFDKWFESAWEKGEAICCVLPFGRSKITEPPPKHCHYVLEHLVNAN